MFDLLDPLDFLKGVLMLKVGYIGLGLMGKSMARNILKAGFPVVVHNRSQRRSGRTGRRRRGGCI